MSTTLSSQIYSSKDAIVSQITEYLKSYLELENISLVKGSFLSFLIETLSILTSNLIFYESSTYKEFFMTKAQLSESIYNLSSFLGYNTIEANYATANVLLTIPLTFTSNDITISIEDGFKFLANSIQFLTYYTTEINVKNNNQVSVTVTDGNKIYDLPTIIDATSSEPEFKFILPVKQYENNIQEFQIDEDLQTYQFTNIDITLNGKVSDITVQIKDPGGTSYQSYTEFNSVYLMTTDDYGYVSRKTSTGRRIYFGNGLIGKQPLPGSTVLVTVKETKGVDGNVIAGSINRGDKLYVTDNGSIKNVNYTVTNTSPATGGKDEESLEEIRKNSINNLTSLNRLVTENDYVNANIVMDDSPITSNSKPVLKRSDVRVNEIQLFVNLLYNNNLVLMKNIYKSFPISTTYIPRGTSLSFEGDNYYTLFDLTIDTTANNTAYYDYIMTSITQVPTLVVSYEPPTGQQPYVIPLNSLTVSRIDSGVKFEMLYDSSESNYSQSKCEMNILSNGTTYDMTNVSDIKKFILEIDDYTKLPVDEQTYYFTISDPNDNNVSKYSNKFTFRKSLNKFMLSNIDTSTECSDTTGVDSTCVIVYDIPVVKSTFYDSTSVVKTDFEVQILQSMLNNMDFVNYKMMTDFVNLKFTNTTGYMKNMLNNKVTKPSVIDISELPSDSTVGDRYIISECDNDYGSVYKNFIAQNTSITHSWSVTSNMPRNTHTHASFGNENGAVSFGGSEYNIGYFNYSYLWNNIVWTEVSANLTSAAFRAGCGNTDSGMSAGGINTSASLNNCEIWNGSSWTNTNTLNMSRHLTTLFGDTNDALLCGGIHNKYELYDATSLETVEIWNGVSWTNTSSLPKTIDSLGGVGTTTTGLVFGGTTDGNKSDECYKWNGNTWLTTSSLNINRIYAGESGTIYNAIYFGGSTTNGDEYSSPAATDEWNDSTWSTTTSLNKAVVHNSGEGSINLSISFGGVTAYGNHELTNATEKWSSSTIWSLTEPVLNETVEVKGYEYTTIPGGYFWSLTSSMPRTTSFHGSFGDENNSISFCGSGEGTYYNYSYSWDGVSWAETSNNPRTASYKTGSGDSNNGLSIGGSNVYGVRDECEKWNGETWSTTTSLTNPRTEMTAFGSTSDTLSCGGSINPTGYDMTAVSSVEIWNGSTWSTTTELPSENRLPGSVGTTNDGIVFGGITAEESASYLSQKWDGSLWSITGSLTISRFAGGDCGTTNNALFSGGGTRSGSVYSGDVSTDIWNGSLWSTTNNLNIVRLYNRSEGSVNTSLSFGGRIDGSNNTNTTEKWLYIDTSTVQSVKSNGYNYIYNGKNWILPIYNIPLQISIDVFKEDTYTGSDIDLANLVRTTLVDAFSDRFGSNVEIFRSEIIKTVQEIDGISYCELIKPESNIYFNFELEDLNEQQLLQYSPEYIYFTSDSISLRIL